MIKPRRKTLDPVRPNEGIAAAYHRQLRDLVREMHNDVLAWAKEKYEEHPPRLAQDSSPAEILNASLRRLMWRWQRHFDGLAQKLAEHFAKSVSDRSDRALQFAMRKAGMTVKFQMSPKMQDVYQAVIAEQVGLIKSIPEKHLNEVQGLVMRSIQHGRDLGPLAKDIQERYGITRNRAALIARDQNNKATAVLTQVRCQELGITEAIWVHSGGGRHPRPEHVAFSGKKYNIAKGAYLEGKWVWPGSEINCRCVSKPIIPGF